MGGILKKKLFIYRSLGIIPNVNKEKSEKNTYNGGKRKYKNPMNPSRPINIILWLLFLGFSGL